MNQARLLVVAIILLLIGGFVFKSCTKSDDGSKCDHSGEVIYYVSDKCGCCPGWVVVSGSDTLKFETVPENDYLWGFVNTYGYPISINFSYTNSAGACADFYKEMTCIELPEFSGCINAGSIIGYNSTECLCCPGWLIKTNTDTIKAASLPNENIMWDLVQNQGFPVNIMFDYEDLEGVCSDSYKDITCVTLVNAMN